MNVDISTVQTLLQTGSTLTEICKSGLLGGEINVSSLRKHLTRNGVNVSKVSKWLYEYNNVADIAFLYMYVL
jgi:hypothetical protein